MIGVVPAAPAGGGTNGKSSLLLTGRLPQMIFDSLIQCLSMQVIDLVGAARGIRTPDPLITNERFCLTPALARACCCIGEPKADRSGPLLIHLPSIALLALAALAAAPAQAGDDAAQYGKGTNCYRNCYPTRCDRLGRWGTHLWNRERFQNQPTWDWSKR
jgi:hypothetical protein